MKLTQNVQLWAQQIRDGDRASLARSITLVESRRPEDRIHAQALLHEVRESAGLGYRVGITGVPGVGKSSVIEQLGMYLVQEGYRPAVLAIDPSSPRSGGSILADKTRMTQLAREPRAFVRPSPTSGFLGGVARWTRETAILCDAAGYDVILIETVGVGQSEVKVVDLVDCLVLLLLPGAGDAMQGIKRGIMEVADLFVVNKADGSTKVAAELAVAELLRVVRLMGKSTEQTAVVTCSTQIPERIQALWHEIFEFKARQQGSSNYSLRRSEQKQRWMWREIEDSLLRSFRNNPVVAKELPECVEKVKTGSMSPEQAADLLLKIWRNGKN